ncbi:MAG: hypothetical protein IPH13_04455 [Planctomycetes bacterium]|nr:hypothetical protein [Planctomycetota bacterium]MCC7171780.1 hypothetical protein [Planctomycetota bacterium]
MSGRGPKRGDELERALILRLLCDALIARNQPRPEPALHRIRTHAQEPVVGGSTVEADVLGETVDGAWRWHDAKLRSRTPQRDDLFTAIEQAFRAFERRRDLGRAQDDDRFVMVLKDEPPARAKWSGLAGDLALRGRLLHIDGNEETVDRFLRATSVRFVRLDGADVDNDMRRAGLLADGAPFARLREVVDVFAPSHSNFDWVTLDRIEDKLESDGVLHSPTRLIHEAVRWLEDSDSRRASSTADRLDGLERSALRAKLHTAVATNHVLVLGDAGVGKSHLLRSFVDSLESGRAIYVESALFATEEAATKLRFARDPRGARVVFEGLVQKHGSGYVLVVDGFDEVTTSERRKQVVEILRAARATSGLRVIVGSRSVVPELDSRLQQSVRLTVDELSTDEVRRVGKSCAPHGPDVDRLDPRTLKLIANPLRLELFLAAFTGAPGSKSFPATTTALVNAFLREKLEGEPRGARARDAAKRLAVCMRGGSTSVAGANQGLVGIGESDWQLLVGLGILRPGSSRQFRHRVFHDYFNALSLLDEEFEVFVSWLTREPDALDRVSVLRAIVGILRAQDRENGSSAGDLASYFQRLLELPNLPANLRYAVTEAVATEFDEDLANDVVAWITKLPADDRRRTLQTLLKALERLQDDTRSDPRAEAILLRAALASDIPPPWIEIAEVAARAVIEPRIGARRELVRSHRVEVRRILTEPLSRAFERLTGELGGPVAAFVRVVRAMLGGALCRCLASIQPAACVSWIEGLIDIDDVLARRLYDAVPDLLEPHSKFAVQVWRRSVDRLLANQSFYVLAEDEKLIGELVHAQPEAMTLAVLSLVAHGTERRLEARGRPRAIPDPLTTSKPVCIADGTSRIMRSYLSPDERELDAFDAMLRALRALPRESKGQHAELPAALRAIELRGVTAYPRAKLLEWMTESVRPSGAESPPSDSIPVALLRSSVRVLLRTSWVQVRDLRRAADEALDALKWNQTFARCASRIERRWDTAGLKRVAFREPTASAHAGASGPPPIELLLDHMDHAHGIDQRDPLRLRTLAARVALRNAESRPAWRSEELTALLTLSVELKCGEAQVHEALRRTIAWDVARFASLVVAAPTRGTPQLVDLARDLLVRLASDPDPSHDPVEPESVRSFGQSVRAHCAEGLLRLASHLTLNGDERNAVRSLAGDRVAPVRFAISAHAGMLLSKHSDLFWDVVLERMEHESGAFGSGVLTGFFHAFAWTFWNDRARTRDALRLMWGRRSELPAAKAEDDPMQACSNDLFGLAIRSGERQDTEFVLTEFVNADNDALERLCTSARDALEPATPTADVAAIRARDEAFRLWTIALEEVARRGRGQEPGSRGTLHAAISDAALWIMRSRRTFESKANGTLESGCEPDPVRTAPQAFWNAFFALESLVHDQYGLDLRACRLVLGAAKQCAQATPEVAIVLLRMLVSASKRDEVAHWIANAVAESIADVLRELLQDVSHRPTALAILGALRPFGAPPIDKLVEENLDA